MFPVHHFIQTILITTRIPKYIFLNNKVMRLHLLSEKYICRSLKSPVLFYKTRTSTWWFKPRPESQFGFMWEKSFFWFFFVFGFCPIMNHSTTFKLYSIPDIIHSGTLQKYHILDHSRIFTSWTVLESSNYQQVNNVHIIN